MCKSVVLSYEIIEAIEDLLSYMELSEEEGVKERFERNTRILAEGGLLYE